MRHGPFVALSVDAASAEADFWGTAASALQSGITVGDSAITGTLKHLSSGQLVTDWGEGNFLALDFNGITTTGLTSLKVGLDPSEGSGLVEILGDAEMLGVFKVTDKDRQDFRLVATDGTHTTTKVYDLSGLTCEAS